MADDTDAAADERRPSPRRAARRRRRPVLVAAVAVGVVAVFLVVVFAVSKVGGSDTADTPLLGQAAPAITRPAPSTAAVRPVAPAGARGWC